MPKYTLFKISNMTVQNEEYFHQTEVDHLNHSFPIA